MESSYATRNTNARVLSEYTYQVLYNLPRQSAVLEMQFNSGITYYEMTQELSSPWQWAPASPRSTPCPLDSAFASSSSSVWTLVSPSLVFKVNDLLKLKVFIKA